MIKSVATVLLAMGIPLMLLATVWQTSRYSSIDGEISRMEHAQYEMIEANVRLIAGITVLSTPERIERVATNDLSMRKARAEEILRIELAKGNLGG